MFQFYFQGRSLLRESVGDLHHGAKIGVAVVTTILGLYLNPLNR